MNNYDRQTHLNVKALIDESSLRPIHLRVFLCCLVSLTFEGYDLVVYGATLPILMNVWHMTPSFAGAIASVGFGAAVVGSILGGAMGDHWGRKKTIIFSVVIYSLGSFACALAHSPWIFACFRSFAGIGMGMTLQNEVGMVSEYFPVKSRQAAVAGVATGMQLGGILSALVAILLIERYGWMAAYFFGSLPIFLVPLLVRYLPEAPWMLVLKKRWTELRNILLELRPDMEHESGLEYSYPQTEEQVSSTAIFFKIFDVFGEGRGLSTVLFWIVYFMNIFAIYGTNTWIPKLMIDSGHSVRASLTIYLALFAGALAVSPILGRIADKCGTKSVSIFCYLFGFALILLLAVPMSLPLTIFVVILVGACTMGAQNITHAYIAQFFPPSIKSTMMGWGLSVGRFGGLLGPVVGGILLSRHVSIQISYLAFALPCLISALAIAFVQDRYAFHQRLNVSPATLEALPGFESGI